VNRRSHERRIFAHVVPAALVAVVLGLGSLPPLARVLPRARSRSAGPVALHGSMLVTEPTDRIDDDSDSWVPVGLRAVAQRALPSLAIGLAIVHLVLRAHRLAHVPVAVRRLKLPPSSHTPSLPL